MASMLEKYFELPSSDDDDDDSSTDGSDKRYIRPVGKNAPGLRAQASNSSTKGYEIDIKNYIERGWVLILFYPVLDDPAYLQEIQEFAKRHSDFLSFGCDILVVVGEEQDEIDRCLSRPTNQGGLAGVDFAIVGDIGGEIAEKYKATNDLKYRILQASVLVQPDGVINSASYHCNKTLRTVDLTELLTKSAIQPNQ